MNFTWKRLHINNLSSHLKNVLEYEKLLRFIMTKTDNRFVISLDFGYALHHCNAEKLICLDQSQHGTLIGNCFSSSSCSEKIYWAQGCISLCLLQSFVFKFYLSKLSVPKKLGLLFYLTFVQCLGSGFSRGSTSRSRSGK